MKIDKYLTQGEVIDKTFTLKGFDVQATNKRLFISSFDGKVVQDFVYDHISSLLFTAKRYHWLMVLGAAIVIGSLFYMNSVSRTPFRMGFDWFWIGILAGVACILLGIFLKKEVMLLFVIGIPANKIPFLEGDRKHLDDLFRTIREKKGESNASAPNVEEES
jgi:hypothetical protein